MAELTYETESKVLLNKEKRRKRDLQSNSLSLLYE